MKTKLSRFFLTLCTITICTCAYGQIFTQRLVKDICTVENSQANYFNYITSDGQGIFFVAVDDSLGSELWYSDGTKSGTKVLKDITPNGTFSATKIIGYADSLLYFTILDTLKGYLVWRSNGTETGTYPVKYNLDDTITLLASNYNIKIFGNSIFYFTKDFRYGESLLKHNITTGQVSKMRFRDTTDIPKFSVVTNNGLVVFTENNETYRLSIIDKFTGTSSSLRLHDSVGLIEVDDISSVGESIFFTARLSSTKIKSLFRYDILAENLVQFPSVYIGGNPNYLGLSVDHLVSGDSIYFVTNGHFGSEIWMAHTQDDDLEIVYAGGSGLPDWNHRPNYLHINDGSLYFTTIAPFPADIRYFWKVDLANYKIETFDYFTNDSIYTTGQGFVVSDNKLFFNGYRADVGSELFYINLLTNKTQIVEDVTEGGLSSNTTPIIRVRDNLFTMSYSDILGRELGTVSISEEPSFQWLTLTGQIPGSSSPNVLTPTSDNLFFIANNVINGTQLWNTDLSTESTNLTQLRSTSIIGSSFRDLTNVNGYLYFKYKNSSNGKYTLGRVSPKGVIKESAYPLVYP